MAKPPKTKPSKRVARFGKDQPAHFCGKKGRSGPKPGNLNSLKNGSRLRSTKLKLGRDGLVIGNIPIKAVRDQARAYRRKLVTEVLGVRGIAEYEDLTAADKHGIHAAVAAVAHSAICRWLLRTKLKAMSIADVRATSKEIKSAARDAADAVRQLDLNAPPPAPWIETTSEPGNGDET